MVWQYLLPNHKKAEYKYENSAKKHNLHCFYSRFDASIQGKSCTDTWFFNLTENVL
jgi:hypothetical protein